jgi:hypothetical protein
VARWQRPAPALAAELAPQYAAGMCRSIRQLRRPEEAGHATTGEARAAALQYVRKVSGFREPSARNAEAFRDAVEEIAHITEHLLESVGTPVEDGPDPFADPVTRRAILAARPASQRRAPMRERATAGEAPA